MQRRKQIMTGLQVFQVLKARMGDRDAEALVTYVDTSFKDNRKELLEDIRGAFASKEDLVKVKGDLEVKIADAKSDVIRWMFAFFVAILIAILGLYFKK